MRNTLKDIWIGLASVGILTVHIYGCWLLFGMATAIVYGAIQVLSAVWLAYELIRSPVYDE